MKRLFIFILLCSITLPSHAFFWNKKDRALEQELQGKGYAGKLPNLNDSIEKNKIKTITPIFESQDDFNDSSDLKPVPKDNPAFIDIIQKKDKNSPYVDDAYQIIPMMEKLVDSIENQESLQLFTAKANVLILNIDFVSNKYKGRPEYYFESMKRMQQLNQFLKSLVMLRREAVVYERYLAYSESGSIYNPQNIEQQLEYLLEELNSTILLLREEI